MARSTQTSVVLEQCSNTVRNSVLPFFAVLCSSDNLKVPPGSSLVRHEDGDEEAGAVCTE